MDKSQATEVSLEHSISNFENSGSIREAVTDNKARFKNVRDRIVKEIRLIEENKEPYFYVIDYEDSMGFTLISADKRFPPVVAYSYEGNFGYSDTLEGVSTVIRIL